MARRNDRDEIQERTNKRVKVEVENANDEVKVSFTVQDFLDGRCTIADLAADALRDVESLVYTRIERAKERLEKLITRLEMEQEAYEYEPPAVPVIVLALPVPGAPPLGLPAVAPPPAAPAPGGEQPRD